MMNTVKKIVPLGLILILFSCSDDSGSDTVDFDRGPILENLANNIIVPSYENLVSTTDVLITETESFVQDRSEQNLTDVKDAWLNARLSWKTSEAFTFGPIDQRFLDTKMDLFPISIVGLQNAIADFDGSDDYLNLVGSDKKGFGAMEYLLFAGTDEEILQRFEDEKYQGYLRLLSVDVNSIAETVLNDWNTSYTTEFIANTGNDAGASITLYTNDMIELVEIIKNFKLSIPFGTRTGTDPFPDLVESPHAGLSKQLILQNLDVVEEIFTGATGSGLDDYLNTLNISLDDGQPLSEAILDQIEECRRLTNALTDLKDDVVNQPDNVQALI
ncbi:MAG: imelysin family protein, partial [Bacteroidota bacterium]